MPRDDKEAVVATIREKFLALSVLFDERERRLSEDVLLLFVAVVLDRQERPPERVDVRDPGRVRHAPR